MKFPLLSYVLLAFVLSLSATSTSAQNLSDCLLDALNTADAEQRVADLKQQCAEAQEQLDAQPGDTPAALGLRLAQEKNTQDNDFVMTPHLQNYLLPLTHQNNPNQEPWLAQDTYPGFERPIEHAEAKMQVSLKVPLTYQDLLFKHDGVYVGFTLKFFWQVYNKELSAPFRETNYRPEIFYQAPITWRYWDSIMFTRIGFEHESNGRSELLSRSWNRVYLGLGVQRGRWLLYLQPWYRVPEDAKEDDGDPLTPPPPEGDDNPDIEDYFGHYEFWGVYDYHQYELSSMLRQNFDTGKGAFELGITFPMWKRIKAYVQFFNGYGESLIDYNHSVQRISVGFLLTDFL